MKKIFNSTVVNYEIIVNVQVGRKYNFYCVVNKKIVFIL